MRNIADSVPRVPLGYLQPEANTFPAYKSSMLKLPSALSHIQGVHSCKIYIQNWANGKHLHMYAICVE